MKTFPDYITWEEWFAVAELPWSNVNLDFACAAFRYLFKFELVAVVAWDRDVDQLCIEAEPRLYPPNGSRPVLIFCSQRSAANSISYAWEGEGPNDPNGRWAKSKWRKINSRYDSGKRE